MNIPNDATPLRTGDIILVTGVHSNALVKAQRVLIPSAISSHVLVAHGETICIDATPNEGVRNRFLLDVFANIAPTWRVIRKIGLDESKYDDVIKACAYFLNQSYLIHPSERIGKSKSYCSELARKIYQRSGISIDVPEKGLVMPAHFDLIQQHLNGWVDVTDEIASWLDIVRQNEAQLRQMTEQMTAGLKLNRKRFTDREKMRDKLKAQAKKGLISQKALTESLAILDNVDKTVNFKFWDTPVTGKR